MLLGRGGCRDEPYVWYRMHAEKMAIAFIGGKKKKGRSDEEKQ